MNQKSSLIQTLNFVPQVLTLDISYTVGKSNGKKFGELLISNCSINGGGDG